MSSAYRPTGLLVPVITPFAADGRVDLDALERLGAELLDAGATALIALSTTAEPSALDSAERDAVVAACARVCADRGAELVVGAGTNDTRTTIERHEALADVPGVVASLAVVPYYVRPSEAGIVAHFQAVAERSPVPLITYNVPYRTGRGLGAAGAAGAGHHRQHRGRQAGRRGAGRRHARPAGRQARQLRGARRRRRLPLPHHADGRRGRDRRLRASVHRARRGDARRGRGRRCRDRRPHAEALLPLVEALFAEPNPAVIKALLHAEGRIPTPDVRLPLTAATPAALQRAQAAYAAVRN